MEMVVLPSVFVVNPSLFDSLRISERIVAEFHWNTAFCHHLFQENGERGRHGNADSVKDDFRFAFCVVIHTETNLPGCQRFHGMHITKIDRQMSSRMLQKCYRTAVCRVSFLLAKLG